MKLRTLPLVVTLITAPITAFALPEVGAMIGTNPTDATAALAAAGCDVTDFEAENGKIEAKCIETASGELFEVAIDPKTGLVTNVKAGD